MRLYIIQTIEIDEKGGIVGITWHKHLHLFKEDAFRDAIKMGKSAVVIEMKEQETWNLSQIEKSK